MKSIIVCLLIFFPFLGFSQNILKDTCLTDTVYFGNNLFATEVPLKVTLKSDFRKLKNQKLTKISLPAELTYFLSDSQIITKQVILQPRGKNRLENCYIPPLKIIFGKDSTAFFSGSYKMVMKCNDLPKYQSYVLKEYLCYKLYSCISDSSFRVRLIDLTFIDEGKQKNSVSNMYSFIIENDQMIAKRLNMRLDKNENLTQKRINQQNIMRIAMFQFMIGNFDWAVPTQQNLKILIEPGNKYERFAIPYDFDYCGMVDADYAIPNEELKIAQVTDRLYLGECKPLEDFIPVIRFFESKKLEFQQTIQNFYLLDQTSKVKMINYLEGFYKILKSKGFYNAYIKATCKEIK